MSIESFRQIVVPPQNPLEAGKTDDWLDVERQVGLSLPLDFRNYINIYGSGYLCEFIWVFNPFAANRSLNLFKQLKTRLDALREIKQQLPGDVPYMLYPERGGLFPCGATGNGDCIYWLTVGKPDEWSIVVNESRGPDWERFDLGLIDFLEGIMRKTISCSIFPSDFPHQPFRFRDPNSTRQP
ncbi:hypothetical protein GC207_13535 [bacterium]|nr:hypothetical protein [bacterium]